MVSPPSFVTLVLLVCLQTVLLSTVSNCAKTSNMYWNTTNSIFRIDNTDHIIDVNKNNAAFEYDQVNIICPVYGPGIDDDAEKYIIYNVSKEEYETCRITNPSPRVIAVCDKPTKTMYFTITFRPFTPQPGGLEFLPGHDYYFISTSSKDDLHRRIGGRCSTNNMKVVFKVCCANDGSSSPTRNNNNNNNNNNLSVTGSSSGSSTVSSSSTSGGILGVNNNNNNNNNNINMNMNNMNNNNNGNNGGVGMPPSPPPSVLKGGDRFFPGGNIYHHQPGTAAAAPTLPHVPPPAIYPSHPHQPQPPIHNGPPSLASPPKTSITQKKKNKEYSDHPNEVVKNEELTYTGASSALSRPRESFQRLIYLSTVALLVSTLLPTLMR